MLQFWARGTEGLQLKSGGSRSLPKQAESCCLQPREGDLPAVRPGCPDSNTGTTYSRGICAPKPRRGCKLGSGALSQGPLRRGRGVRQQGAGFIKRRPATSARFPDKRSRRRASKQTGERKPCTASRNRARSEAVYSVTQGVKRRVLMQKYIKHQGQIVEKSAKARSGRFQRATKVGSSHGTASCVAHTDRTNFFLKRDLVLAIYCINPEITLLCTHKEQSPDSESLHLWKDAQVKVPQRAEE